MITKIDQRFNQAQQQLNNRQFHISRQARSVLYRFQKTLAEKRFGFDFIPSQAVRAEKQKIAALQRQMSSRLPQLLSAEHKELQRLKDTVHNLSPESILKRGFAILKKDGKILSESATIQKGDLIQIIHQQTFIETEVKNKGERHGEFDL